MATVTLETVDGVAETTTNLFEDDVTGPEFGASKIYTADGWLNGYALAVGYSERAEGVTLYRAEDRYWVGGDMGVAEFSTYEAARAEFVRLVQFQLSLGL